jgi:O-antigen/teichoic acid export membrane protein
MNARVQSLLQTLWGNTTLGNFGWMLLDRLLRLGVSLFVGTWVARYLGPSDYGTLNYGVAVNAILGMIPTLGLESLLRRELARHPEQEGVLVGTTFGLKLGAGFATCLLTVAGAWLLEPQATLRFVIAMSSLTHLLHAAIVFDVRFQARLQSKWNFLAQNTAFILATLARIGLILSHAGLEMFVVLIVLEPPLAALLQYLAYRQTGGRLAGWRWDGRVARQLLRESWPLAFAFIAAALYQRVDQLLVVQLSGVAESGRYAAATRILELMTFVPVALVTSFAPALAREFAAGPAGHFAGRARRLCRLTALLSLALAAGTALAAGVMVRLLFGPAYAETQGFILVLSLAFPAIALGAARDQILIAEGLTGMQLRATLVGVGLNLALNFLLIPRWGGLGAAATAVATRWLAEVGFCFLSPRTRRIGVWQLRGLLGFRD